VHGFVQQILQLEMILFNLLFRLQTDIFTLTEHQQVCKQIIIPLTQASASRHDSTLGKARNYGQKGSILALTTKGTQCERLYVSPREIIKIDLFIL
jgi:hypothetical protein